MLSYHINFIALDFPMEICPQFSRNYSCLFIS